MPAQLKLRGNAGKNRVSIIDDEDFDRCNKKVWLLSGKYVYTRLNGKRVPLQSFILSAPDGCLVDHINLDPLDNRKHNLRMCTVQQNNKNRGITRNNTSGYKGVTIRRNRKQQRYVARIYVDKVEINLGVYDTPLDAALAYDKASAKYHGEFGRPNFQGVDNE